MDKYTPVIGMEIHVELKTKSKMFCGCKNDPFHAEQPNIYTCPVCLGLPGGLPVPNRKAIEWTILLGLALGCKINTVSKFDRKNYFYPDLAKGYQISQYDQPFCVQGVVRVTEGDVRIHRVHLEEDTGKLQHTTIDGKKVSLVDFNRSGVPLVEIVTEPDIHSGEHAKAFLKKLHQIITDLDISDAEMEKGSMRLEPNISIKKPGQTALPSYKVEVKNINSFNFVKKAIEFEIPRHTEILKTGKNPMQETRGWNEDKGETFSQRSKEQAEDYRYFPDPDIPPIRFTESEIDAIRNNLPELAEAKAGRFASEFGLAEHTIAVLISDSSVSEYFENAVEQGKSQKISATSIANWMVNRKIDISSTPIDALLAQISQATAVIDLPEDTMRQAIQTVLTDNPKAVADYKSGKETVMMFLFGQVMKVLHGKGDKAKIQDMLKKMVQ